MSAARKSANFLTSYLANVNFVAIFICTRVARGVSQV